MWKVKKLWSCMVLERICQVASTVAKKFKPIKIKSRIAATEAFFRKRSAAFARFTWIRFLRMHHFDGLKNFCNTTSRVPLYWWRILSQLCRRALGHAERPEPLWYVHACDPDPVLRGKYLNLSFFWEHVYQPVPGLCPTRNRGEHGR